MLSDQDKARILEEETYRREIQPRVDATTPNRTRLQKVWGIVNSAVFIWFVSSVVLGAASFLYNNWRKAADIEREKQDTASRLDAEITNRLVFVDHVLAMQQKETQDIQLSDVVAAANQPSLVPSLANTFSMNVFPEYSNRNLRSLLWELVHVVPDREKQDISRVYQGSLQLEVISVKNRYFQKRSAGQILLNAAQARSGTESYIGIHKFCCISNLERWGKPFSELVGQKDWCSPPKD